MNKTMSPGGMSPGKHLAEQGISGMGMAPGHESPGKTLGKGHSGDFGKKAPASFHGEKGYQTDMHVGQGGKPTHMPQIGEKLA